MLLTIIMLVCFILHLRKELAKFFEAKTTTAIKLESTPTLEMPAVTICAEQVFDVTAPGKNLSYIELSRGTFYSTKTFLKSI